MKKLTLSIFIMGSFGLYVLWSAISVPSETYVAPQPIALLNNDPQATSADQPVSAPAVVGVKPKTAPPAKVVSPTPSPVPKKSGLYSDGTYTGSVADAYYGNVQVEAVITNGKISDVQFLDYPQDRNTSRRINSYAMPQLTQEAISAQSASVNGVSGASDTSAAFKQSLASALAQAKA